MDYNRGLDRNGMPGSSSVNLEKVYEALEREIYDIKKKLHQSVGNKEWPKYGWGSSTYWPWYLRFALFDRFARLNSNFTSISQKIIVLGILPEQFLKGGCPML